MKKGYSTITFHNGCRNGKLKIVISKESRITDLIPNVLFNCDIEFKKGSNLKFIDANNQTDADVKITGNFIMDEESELQCKSLEI